MIALVFFSFSTKHPFYLSVTEMKYNPKEKTVETAVKLFTNDLEDALKKISNQKVDLINGKDKDALNKLLTEYVQKRLTLKLNDKIQTFNFVGFEKEEEATWVYVEYKNCPVPEKVTVDNTLLYDYIPTQINILNFELNGKKKSSKVTNPEKSFLFEF